ncbi:MAG: regulatory protein RecX [Magnetococcales bacterium]|nr:regulatory protein RecX [Magnetococcales bacterium]
MNGPVDGLDRKLYDQALRWLTRRSYGEQELAWRLAGVGGEPGAIAAVLIRCRELGYLDDRAFVLSRIRVRQNQGWGRLRIRAELRSLGLDEAILTEAWAVFEQDADEEGSDPVARARRVLEKRFGAAAGWNRSDLRERGRRYAFLARRGFEAEVIDAALVEL